MNLKEKQNIAFSFSVPVSTSTCFIPTTTSFKQPHLQPLRPTRPSLHWLACDASNGLPLGKDTSDLNGHAIDPEPKKLHPEDEQDEIFFQGLSYPAEVLEWCTTNPPVWDLNNKLKTLIPDDKNTDSSHFTKSPFSAGGVSTRICNGEHELYAPRVEQKFVDTFRMSSPYIHAHQGLIFVIHIPGALLTERLFASVMEDIALMRVVGIKLVLVLGPQLQVDRRLANEGIRSKFIDGVRVTDQRTLQIVMEVAGSMRFEVEATLAKGVRNMPSDSRISVVSGSFYSAQPVGVIDGEDFGYTGKVRKLNVDGIRQRLGQGDIILIPNVASSPSGQHFNCKSEEVAAACAAELQAEKLIFMASGETLYDKRTDHTIPNLTLKSAARFLRLRSRELPPSLRSTLRASVHALEKGVKRAHILNRYLNGVLLMEVFHRDGVGLMISRDLYEGFRRAKLSDLSGLEEIIKPLEESGILKKRERPMLERDIDQFVVIERDGMIIACMSLTMIPGEPTWAEMGCLAVHPKYRKMGKGDAMLAFTERLAFDLGVRNLIILSTQSFDWFRERGFAEVSVEDVPAQRQKKYDRSRKSKIFHKSLEGSRAVR